MASCYRHPSRETAVSCSNCGRPICPDCMTTSPVGMRCPECARQTTKVRTIRSTTRGRSFTMTQALIAINLIVFFAEGSSAFTLTGEADPRLGGASWIFSHGLLFAPYIRFDHDYYLLVTSAFLHFDILHIASNMWVLYLVGRLLEPVTGPRRFIAIYAVGLLAGSLGVMLISPNSPSAGASGAIFGLLAGAFLEAHQRGAEAVRNQLLIWIVFNLVITFSIPEISIGAHIGGLIGGGLATLAFRRADEMRRPALGWAACVSLMVIAVAAAIIVADHAPLPS